MFVSLNNINQSVSVMVKSYVFFAVRTEFLNIVFIATGFVGRIRADVSFTEDTRPF
jgi:hypothetical protein